MPIDLEPITVNIDPVIVQMGPLALRWYSVMIVLGVGVGTWMAARLAERRGLAADDVYGAAIWIIVAGVLGARLAHVLDQWEQYREAPLGVLAIHEGGVAIWGAVWAGGLAAWAYSRWRRLPFWAFADSLSRGAILGQAIGRIGSIITGDAAGRATTLPLAFTYAHPNAMLPKYDFFDTRTHPYALYELVWDLALFGLLWLVARRARISGTVFLVYLGGYSLGRFLLSFLRGDPVWVLGLQQGHLFALLTVVVAVYLWLLRQAQEPGAAQARL